MKVLLYALGQGLNRSTQVFTNNIYDTDSPQSKAINTGISLANILVKFLIKNEYNIELN